MRLQVLVSMLALSVAPASAAPEKCITVEEARQIGVLLGAQSVREGLDVCLRHFPKIKDDTFVPGAEKNLEKAAPVLEKAESDARAGFDRAYGENGGARFDRFRADAMTATRLSLAAFGEIECRVSLVGYAKIAEALAEKPEEARFVSAEDLKGDLPICEKEASAE
jgi:hypothetical protein